MPTKPHTGRHTTAVACILFLVVIATNIIPNEAAAGRVSPDLWMTNAAGTRVGPDTLLEATHLALDSL